jgi:uncharacterized protein (AIM24 family)
MLAADGPGRIAFSHSEPGELIALPLQRGAGVDVRENVMLVATKGVVYDWIPSNVWLMTSGGQPQQQVSAGGSLLKIGLDMAGAGRMDRDHSRDNNNQQEWHYPAGQFLDRFYAPDQPGLVMIQASGNAYVRTLAEGESILIKPPALLFKDPTVGMQLHVEYPAAGMKLWRTWGNRYLWLRVWGPGRVGLQSCYERVDDPGTDFRDLSPHTDHLWR